MSLTQVERDLQNYTIEKVNTLIHDIAQSFDIAGVKKGECLECLGTVLLRTTVMIAMTCHVPRETFLQWTEELFDHEEASANKRKH
jgi:hypothetical protein